MSKQPFSNESSKAQDQGQTRERIIAAAYKVLGAKGYEATTLREIAREAQAAQGLVHYYFGGKEQLIFEVLKTAGDRYTNQTRDLFNKVSPKEFVKAALSLPLERVTNDAEWYRLRFELFALALHNPTLEEGMRTLLVEGRSSIQMGLLLALQGDPSDSTTHQRAEPPLNTLALAAILLAVFDGLALQKILDPQVDLDASYKLLVQLLQYVID